MGSNRTLSRRDVLRYGLGAAGAAILPGFSPSGLRFGLVADVHHGLVPFAEEYLRSFVQEATRRGVDFIVQLGDFCHPEPGARSFLDTWSDFRGPRYGAIGPHDLDYGSKEDAVRWWGIPNRYYSFDREDFHFVVLDANNNFDHGQYVPYEESNFYRDTTMNGHVDNDQLDWLAEDLRRTDKRTVVFMHHSIDESEGGGSCKNRHRVRAVLERANRGLSQRKVVACFQGFHHSDGYELRRGIHYVRTNSLTHVWLGDRFDRTADYAEPLFCFVTMDEGGMVIEGREGQWKGTSPAERKYPGGEKLTPHIANRRLRFA